MIEMTVPIQCQPNAGGVIGQPVWREGGGGAPRPGVSGHGGGARSGLFYGSVAGVEGYGERDWRNMMDVLLSLSGEYIDVHEYTWSRSKETSLTNLSYT
jgi:hypothetical protein